MAIPAGAIKPRVPRPLTDDERKMLRKKNGGYASDKKLAELEAAFAKPKQSKPKESSQGETKPKQSKDNNGWTK